MHIAQSNNSRPRGMLVYNCSVVAARNLWECGGIQPLASQILPCR
ncbi:hypothetical protein PENNAL_c0965G07432 [Penicillium nalgiovense]|uniref:Uncharacterized protein n=1 Tax=Penicillium nalgiovense TaxID=60175 RepID=A0A1V6TQ28_PENNA|nr:hypothetical protein PENNAL_c0965G07432 [Penicillium nalgiovense]